MVEPRWPQNMVIPGPLVPKALEGGSGLPSVAAQLAAGTSPQPPFGDRGAGGGGTPLAPTAVAAYAKRANVPVPVMAELLKKTQDGTLTAPDMMAVMGVPPIYLPKELGGISSLFGGIGPREIGSSAAEYEIDVRRGAVLAKTPGFMAFAPPLPLEGIVEKWGEWEPPDFTVYKMKDGNGVLRTAVENHTNRDYNDCAMKFVIRAWAFQRVDSCDGDHDFSEVCAEAAGRAMDLARKICEQMPRACRMPVPRVIYRLLVCEDIFSVRDERKEPERAEVGHPRIGCEVFIRFRCISV